MKKYSFEYFASCPMGLEELLSQEILSAGAKSTKVVRGGVQFEAMHEIALKVIVHTRFASRVFKYLYTLDVLHEKDYYLEATEIAWKSLMHHAQTFRLTTIFGDLPQDREEFRNSQFANLKLKDAIVDYFRHFDGTRPSVEKEFPDIAFLARVERGDKKPYAVTLMYDLCGDPLNQRGYRIAKTEAPVKENVAAGLLKLVGWNPEVEGLLDAMCGSGTILIEAALLAGNIPPGYLKVERHLTNRGMPMWTFLNYPFFIEDKGYNARGGFSPTSAAAEQSFSLPGMQPQNPEGGVTIEEYAQKAVNNADVRNAPETAIFDIISNRYRSSAWKRLEAKE